MKKNKISNLELGVLSYYITRAFFIGICFNCIINLIKQDGWIIPIGGIVIGIIFIFFIGYIMNYKVNLTLGEKIICLFNKKTGYTIIVIYCVFAFLISILNFLNLNNFIHSQFLNKTPILAISILFMFTIFYILTKGINAISRTGVILFYISFFMFIMTVIGLFPSIELSNIKPIFQSNIKNNFESLNCYFAYNIAPLLLLTIIPKNNIKNAKIKTTLSIFYIITSITLFFVLFITLSTFGYELCKIYQYPEFHVLKHISLIGLSSRIESILVIQWLFDLLILSIFIMFFIGNSVNLIFKTKNINIIYFILCLLLIIGTNYISKYSVFLNNITLNILPFPITVLTILITIIIYIKIKISK